MELKDINFSNCEQRLLKAKKGELFYLYNTVTNETIKIKFTIFVTVNLINDKDEILQETAMKFIDESGKRYLFSTATKRLLDETSTFDVYCDDVEIILLNNKRDIETINKKMQILKIIENEIFSDSITLSTIEPIAQMMIELNKI